jgi:predicted nicotinamide N-methyase
VNIATDAADTASRFGQRVQTRSTINSLIRFRRTTIGTRSSAHILQFIRSNFPLALAPCIPEILLHKAGPKSGLWRLAEMDENLVTPYWAYHWGGGLALARHVLNHPEIVGGRSVLDLGTGSGIVAIAAAKAGAKRVIAADVDPYAITATGLNAAANEVAVSTFVGDLTLGPPPAADVVLVGDLFYEAGLAERVTAFLDRCLGSKIEVFIGDPWRTFLPRTRLQLLAEYAGPDFGQASGGEQTSNAVFRFEAAPATLTGAAPARSRATRREIGAAATDNNPVRAAAASPPTLLRRDGRGRAARHAGRSTDRHRLR